MQTYKHANFMLPKGLVNQNIQGNLNNSSNEYTICIDKIGSDLIPSEVCKVLKLFCAQVLDPHAVVHSRGGLSLEGCVMGWTIRVLLL